MPIQKHINDESIMPQHGTAWCAANPHMQSITVVSMDEQAPTELNMTSVGHAVTVEKDRLTVRYQGEGRHQNDVGAVQANRPCPRKRLVYYYEVTIQDAGQKGKIGIGFAEKGFKLTRQPGWEAGSFGYHGDDGKKFHQTGQGEDYGPKYGTGDVIGAGIHLGRQEMFFTKNGVRLKVAFRGIKGGLYPTVGLHSKNECVVLNFGAKPFRFDLEGMIAEERAAMQSAIDKISLPPQATLQLVCQYLRHEAYADTLTALQAEVGSISGANELDAIPAATATQATTSTAHEPEAMATEGDVTWLTLRQQVRRGVLAGDIDGVLAALKSTCPEVLAADSGHSQLQFRLYCQKFIELVKCGRVADALSWAHNALAPLRSALDQQQELHLRQVIALLAYANPQASPLSYLLSEEQRVDVAHHLNAALLAAAAGLPPSSTLPQACLARVLCQLVEVHAQLLEHNGGQGEPFNLQAMLQPLQR